MIDFLPGKITANTYIIKNKDNEGIIVDPGFNQNNSLINHIHKLGVNIVGILLTHAHYDHIGALEDIVNVFPNAITYLSCEEDDVLDNPKYNLSAYDGVKKLTFRPTNIRLLNDFEKFNLAGFEIEIIHTPFHTKGSSCYYIKDENALFSGDTLFFGTIGRSDLPTGSSRSIDSSLRKLLALPLSTKIYPGHGALSTLERERKYNTYLNYL